MRSTTAETSDFYHACAISDIPRVKSHLARMNINEMNRTDLNGDTALHIAAYHQNAGVVYLLLRNGAIGSIKNRYDLIPSEETTSTYIKQLLSTTGNAGWIEWTFVDSPTRETKHAFDSALKNAFLTMGLSFILDFLLNQYVRRYIAEALPKSRQKIKQ